MHAASGVRRTLREQSTQVAPVVVGIMYGDSKSSTPPFPSDAIAQESGVARVPERGAGGLRLIKDVFVLKIRLSLHRSNHIVRGLLRAREHGETC